MKTSEHGHRDDLAFARRRLGRRLPAPDDRGKESVWTSPERSQDGPTGARHTRMAPSAARLLLPHTALPLSSSQPTNAPNARSLPYLGVWAACCTATTFAASARESQVRPALKIAART